MPTLGEQRRTRGHLATVTIRRPRCQDVITPSRDGIEHVDRQTSEENPSVGGEPVCDESAWTIKRRPQKLRCDQSLAVEQRLIGAPRCSVDFAVRQRSGKHAHPIARRTGRPAHKARRVGMDLHVRPLVAGGSESGLRETDGRWDGVIDLRRHGGRNELLPIKQLDSFLRSDSNSQGPAQRRWGPERDLRWAVDRASQQTAGVAPVGTVGRPAETLVDDDLRTGHGPSLYQRGLGVKGDSWRDVVQRTFLNWFVEIRAISPSRAKNSALPAFLRRRNRRARRPRRESRRAPPQDTGLAEITAAPSGTSAPGDAQRDIRPRPSAQPGRAPPGHGRRG